jgi:tetratricopeptide (TPR) repeat protein
MFLCGLVLLATWRAAGAPAQENEAVAELRRGGRLPGRIVEYEPIDGFAVRVNAGLTLGISDNEIRRIRDNDEAMRAYRQRLAQLDDEPQAHYLIHRWCSSQGLYDQMQRHLERCIELDPNHSDARAALGYTRHKNRWVKIDSLFRSRGMVRDGGKWRTAEEVVQLEQSEQLEQSRIDAKKQIAAWKKQARRDTPAGRDARAQLAQINDPAFDVAVIEEFRAAVEAGARRDQLFWLEILGRLNTPVCRDTIIQASMDAPSQSVRERCYELLEGEHKYRAIAYYLSHLQSSDNEQINRAASALSYLNDPEIVLALVRALRTEHSIIFQPGAGMNVGMNRSTGNLGSFTAGGNKPVRKTVVKENPDVLTALLEVIPDDVNFQYDEAEWLRYLAAKKAPPPGDLRRDP